MSMINKTMKNKEICTGTYISSKEIMMIKMHINSDTYPSTLSSKWDKSVPWK